MTMKINYTIKVHNSIGFSFAEESKITLYFQVDF